MELQCPRLVRIQGTSLEPLRGFGCILVQPTEGNNTSWVVSSRIVDGSQEDIIQLVQFSGVLKGRSSRLINGFEDQLGGLALESSADLRP